MDINESTLCFGHEQGLVGVLAIPNGGAAVRVGCLLLNVGVNHRIGPRRLNVKMGRRLAAAGIPSLRFDISGVGDSRASAAQNDFRQQALVDMKAALDHLQSATGLERFIVIGICSGAVNGMALAVADPRVVGLMMLDGYTFLTPAVRAERKLRRLAAFAVNPAIRRSFAAWTDWTAWLQSPLDPQARRRALARALGRATPRSTEETGILTADTTGYQPHEFLRDMKGLVDRGVDVYLVYTASVVPVDRGRQVIQGLGQPAFLSRVRYEHWPDVDHTSTLLAAQRHLLEAACGWAVAIHAAQPAALPAAPKTVPMDASSQRLSAAARMAALDRRLGSQGSV